MYNTPNSRIQLSEEVEKKYTNTLKEEFQYVVFNAVRENKLPVEIDLKSFTYLKGGMSIKKLEHFDHKTWFFAKGTYRPVNATSDEQLVKIEVQRGPNKETGQTEDKLTVKLYGFDVKNTCYNIIL